MQFDNDKPLFPISIASELTGLHNRTLMLYERAELIKPQRTPTDRRRYSQQDIEKIKFIHYLAKKHRANLAGIRLLLHGLSLCKNKAEIKDLLFPDYEARQQVRLSLPENQPLPSS